jgi:excisionase family DNA binding protein
VIGRLLTVAAFAERLGVSERWVRRAIFEHRIAYVKLGRLVRIEEHIADDLIAAGRVEPTVEGDLRRLPARARVARP